MFYAIIESGDKQFQVSKGKTILVPEIEAEKGTVVTFDRVLLCSNGEQVCVGKPLVPNAKVTGVSLGEIKGEKLVVFKMRRRKASIRKTGHRQKYTGVKIDMITGPIEAKTV